jgi:putative ABC transport system substrate-binding protein
MRRIGLVLLVSLVIVPLAVEAQQPGKLHTIGFMGSGTAAAQSQWTAAFVRRLRELGWTGLSSQAPDTAGKKLELLRELVPSLRRLAILTDVGNPFAALDAEEFRKAAQALGLEVFTSEIRGAGDIDRAFDALKGRAQAVYVIPVPLLFVNRVRINNLALAARLPTLHGVSEYVEAGGLMSYGPDWPRMWSRTADLVDRILRGAKPADLPVEQPTKFELIVNLKISKALGLTIPQSLLMRADQVIE